MVNDMVLGVCQLHFSYPMVGIYSKIIRFLEYGN